MPDTSERKLDDRETAVLRAVVYEYITTGKPVGSRSFVQKYNFSLSPATMRNIMYDLESLAYLKQPHTSAGRIPTDLGYRFYVDTLLDTYNYTPVNDIQMKADVMKRELQLEKIFSSITRMLSQVSNYAGIMLTPKPHFTIIKRIELVPLDNDEVLVIIITRTGIVFNRKIVLSQSVTHDQLHNFSIFLSSELCGFSIDETRSRIIGELRVRHGASQGISLALDIVELSLKELDNSSLVIDGIENLLRIPEMVEEERLNSLLHIIEEKNILREIMENALQDNGITTLIGAEILNDQVQGCSMVTTGYRIGNRNVGVVGLLGPTRMDYERAVPLVDYTGRLVSDFLTQMSK